MAISLALVPIILFLYGVFTPSTAYATDSGEEVDDSQATPAPAETASEEVIQSSNSEADTQLAVEEEEPAEATAEEPVEESSSSEVVTETVTSGGDDSSYLIPIEVPVIFDGVEYTNIYATTNSVITFGQQDGTYWDYPQTPSVSIESRDWWTRPYSYQDEWFILRTSSGGFQVDGSYRPFGTNGGETTNIVITAQIQKDGTVSYTYSVVGTLYGNERTGARLHDGSVVSLEEAGINQVEEPVVLEPEPVEPEPEPTPSEPEPAPSEEVEETPAPQPAPSPTPAPVPDSTPVQPERTQQQTPVQEQPTPEPPREPRPAPVQQVISPEPTPEDVLDEVLANPNSSREERVEAIIATVVAGQALDIGVLLDSGVEFSDLPPETPIEVREDSSGNAVVIDAKTAASLEVFTSTDAFIEEVFSEPAAVVSALANVGKDMSEEEREESQQVVVASVIVANVANLASQAASAAAGGAVSYRRKL